MKNILLQIARSGQLFSTSTQVDKSITFKKLQKLDDIKRLNYRGKERRKVAGIF
jgi:hypothetical protein